jgi:hypothetical protein
VRKLPKNHLAFLDRKPKAHRRHKFATVFARQAPLPPDPYCEPEPRTAHFSESEVESRVQSFLTKNKNAARKSLQTRTAKTNDVQPYFTRS